MRIILLTSIYAPLFIKKCLESLSPQFYFHPNKLFWVDLNNIPTQMAFDIIN